MIDRQIILGPIAFLALLASAQAGAAQQSTASAAANVEIVESTLNLTAVSPLAFGRIKSSAEGTVIIDVHGIRTSTGGVELIGSGGCTTELCDTTNPSNPKSASYWTPAVYTVTGVPGGRYTVNAPPDAVAVLQSGNTDATVLPVSSVVAATDSSEWDSNIGYLDAAGQGTIRVGGTLHVPCCLSASSYYLYDANVMVTVEYN